MSNETLVAHELIVPPGWECARLDDLVDQERGISYGIVQPGKQDDAGVPIVRVNNIRAGRLLTNDVMRVSAEVEAGYRRTRLRGGEILLSLVGTLGECAVVPASLAGWNVARAVAVIPLRDGIDADWVAMCLRSAEVQSLMHGWATTTVQATLNLRDVRRLPILLAPEPDRSDITRAVRLLDDKIEQNRRTGAKLEGLARAVFKAWFVDFEPVKAKAAGATAFPGMPPETFAALPTRFIDSALGRVPEGWSPSPIGDFVEDIYDGPHATPPESTDGAVFLGIKNLTGTRIDLGDIRRINERDWPRWTKRVEPRADDIVFTYEATIGFFAIIPPGLRCCLGRRMALMRPKAGVRSRYLFHYTISDRFQQLLAERTVYGSTVNRTSLLEFPKYLILMPTPALVTGFDSVVAPLWSSLHASDTESAKLATLRDYLLPRLLSGRVRVEAVRD